MRWFVLVLSVGWWLGCNSNDVGVLPCAAQQECSACEACISDRCVPVQPSDDVFPSCDEPVDCAAFPASGGGRLPIDTGVHRPIVTWTGSGYALSWYDVPNGAFVGFANLDGELDPASVRSIDPRGLFPRTAFNGDEYAVVHIREGGGTDEPLPRKLFFTRLDASGDIVVGSQVQVGTTLYPEDPAVVWDERSRQWGVLWEDHDSGGVFFARVDASGAPVADSQLRLSPEDVSGQLGGGGAPLLAIDGEFIAVWSEALPGRVQLARIGGDGNVRSVSSQPASQPAPGGQPYRASITWDGHGYGVAWMESSATSWQIYFARARADASFVSDSVVRLGELGEEQSHPQVLWTGNGYSVFWSSYQQPDDADVWLTPLSADAVPQPRQQLTSGGTREWFPNAVWDGCRHVVLYAADGSPDNAGYLVFSP